MAIDPRVRASFERQSVMRTIGTCLLKAESGEAVITMAMNAAYTQQHGFLHAGVVATIADSACGYAAFSVMPTDAAVLTVEYKIDLLRPASGERFIAEARVIKQGKTLMFCAADVYAETAGERTHVATMLATIMAVFDKEGIEH